MYLHNNNAQQKLGRRYIGLRYGSQWTTSRFDRLEISIEFVLYELFRPCERFPYIRTAHIGTVFAYTKQSSHIPMSVKNLRVKNEMFSSGFCTD